jgi:flagellin-like hook-associated protein FlgL
MNISVSNIGFASTFIHDMKKVQMGMMKAQQQIQSGQRISSASDDPLAMGVVLKNQSQKRMTSAWDRNRELASSIAESTHAKLSQYHEDIQVVAQEIASKTSSRSTADLQLYAVEINGLLHNGLSVLQTRHPLGDYLFGGTKANGLPFSVTKNADNEITSITYTGGNEVRSFTVSEDQQFAPQLPPAKCQKLAEFMTHLIELRDAFQSGDVSLIHDKRALLQQDESMLLNFLSDVGGMATRLEAFKDNNEYSYKVLDQVIGGYVEADWSAAVTRFTQYQTALEAAMKSSQRVLNANIFNYI